VERVEGTIQISLKQDGDTLHLRIKDNGVGMPDTTDWEAVGSLGLKLVHALVEQLDGEIAFSNENGARVSLKLVAA
jgi:two-component sensor histidine kinase